MRKYLWKHTWTTNTFNSKITLQTYFMSARISPGKSFYHSKKIWDSTRQIWWENRTIKMATSTSKSMTEELLEAIKDKTYDSCVSNLTKTHCVNLKKFRREWLPKGTWITTKRFVSKTNQPMPDAMLSLFGEFSSQSGTDVHDTMIGWSYDNMITSACLKAPSKLP